MNEAEFDKFADEYMAEKPVEMPAPVDMLPGAGGVLNDVTATPTAAA